MFKREPVRLDGCDQMIKTSAMQATGQVQVPARGRWRVRPGAVARTFDTPAFGGMTFRDWHAKSIISGVPATCDAIFGSP